MADNEESDRARVRLDDNFELQVWADHFGVTREKIKQAVEYVGPMVADVAKWIAANRDSAATIGLSSRRVE